MIKNEKQYKISKKKLSEVLEKIHKIKSTKEESLKQQLVLASIEDFRDQLEKEIKEYETLKSGRSKILRERNIADLPSMIIEYKIVNNLTHKELANKLGLKEQQLQRYESEGFKTVSFQNLIRFIKLMNLDLRIKKTSIRTNRYKNLSAK
jgi:hypothetical protein